MVHIEKFVVQNVELHLKLHNDYSISHKKPAAESTVAGFVCQGKSLFRNNYPSLIIESISPDFSPVMVFTKKYLRKTLGAASLTVP